MAYGIGVRRLTADDRRKIVRLYLTDHMTQSAIAERFGVSHGSINKVLREENATKPNRTLTVK